MSYTRRQQYRRLRRAAGAASGSAAAGLLALVIASAGAMSHAGCLLIIALGLGLYARRWVLLAGRGRVDARSEDQVQRALAVLEAEGWRLRHSLRWLGPGDIDSVAVAPTGIAVVIETKTMTYQERHLDQVRMQAAWLVRRQPIPRCGEPPRSAVARPSVRHLQDATVSQGDSRGSRPPIPLPRYWLAIL